MSHSHPSDLMIRKLTSKEMPLYADFILSLDRTLRRDRFHAGVSDDFIRAHAKKLFEDNDAVIHAAFRGDAVAGVAELCIDPNDNRAEAAFAVSKDHQGLGVGTALMEATILAARNRNLRSLKVMCLRSNLAMRKIAMRSRAKFMIEVDEVAGEIKPAAPNVITWMRELLMDQLVPVSRIFSRVASRAS
jgi:GNAT superfamily N-acetyltransferase